MEELNGANGAKAKFDVKNHVEKEMCSVDGLWTTYLDFDGKR